MAQGKLRFGRLEVRVLERAQAERELASEIARIVEANVERDEATVLGFPTGSSPLGLYAELARRYREETLLAEAIVPLQLDEYAGVDADDPRSFRAWLREHLLAPLGMASDPIVALPGHLSPEFEPRYLEAFDKSIAEMGGIDLLLLGLGRNGHIAFNEPGSQRSSRTRRVELAPSTREAAVAVWGSLENVPTHAVTLGVATLLDARRVRALAFGSAKREVVQRTLTDPIGPQWPATFLRQHGDARLYVDAEALGELEAS